MLSNDITDNTHAMNNIPTCIYKCIQPTYTYIRMLITHISNWCYMTHILPGDSIISGDVTGVVVSMHTSKTINKRMFVTKLISELNFLQHNNCMQACV